MDQQNAVEADLDSGLVDWVYDGNLTARGWCDGDIRTLARVLLRQCPTCHIEPGFWCRTTTGTPIERLDGQHAPRRRLDG